MIDTDERMTQLLRLASARAPIPIDRAERVRRAVLDECRAVSRARRVQRRVAAAVAAMAVAAVALLVVRVGLRSPATPAVAPAMAAVERLEGSGGRVGAANAGTAAMRLALSSVVRLGERIETDQSGRVAMRLPDGASVRFDRGSSARFSTARVIELDAGAVYVDSGPNPRHLEVRTRFGVFRDVGTQFEIRVGDAGARVRVRSGIVEWRRGREVSSARRGVELTADAAGVTRRAVTPYGDEWSWTSALTPAFVIEGRTLAAFLEHLCREEGWTLVYENPALARQASGIILHGSTAGLPPADAVSVVLATAGLTSRLEEGQLVVSRSVPR